MKDKQILWVMRDVETRGDQFHMWNWDLGDALRELRWARESDLDVELVGMAVSDMDDHTCEIIATRINPSFGGAVRYGLWLRRIDEENSCYLRWRRTQRRLDQIDVAGNTYELSLAAWHEYQRKRWIIWGGDPDYIQY